MTELAAPEWVEEIIFPAWVRLEKFVKRIGHPDWLPRQPFLPMKNRRAANLLGSDEPLPHSVVDDIENRAPMTGDLLRIALEMPGARSEAYKLWGVNWAGGFREAAEAAQRELNGVARSEAHPGARPLTLLRILDLIDYINPPDDASGILVFEGPRTAGFTQYQTLSDLGLDPRLYKPEPKAEHAPLVDYGCGHFGCVLPTHADNVVLKITTDPSEAVFANLAARLGAKQPPGFVKYFAVVELKGVSLPLRNEEEKKRGHRAAYLLWREEAYDIGFLEKSPYRGDRATHKLLADILMAARPLRLMLAEQRDILNSPAKYRKFLELVFENVKLGAADPGLYSDVYDMDLGDEQLIAKDILGMRRTFERVRDTPGDRSQKLGEGCLQWLQEQQITFADIHGGNVGKDEGGVTVVTDPGMALQIGPKNYPPPKIKVI